MKKLTVYGLPLNPMPLLEKLRGASFCVSYATRDKLGKQLDQAIELVGEDQILLVDNGAFSAWRSGVDTMNDEAYLEGFADWANDILERCPQAIAVIPDKIDGTHQENAQLVCETMTMLPSDRAMPIWHMHEPISYLLYLCEGFDYVGIGSSGEYASGQGAKWRKRMDEVFAAIDAWELESEGAYIRPRIHMMRSQSQAHLYAFDSSDSTNVAVNHNRQANKAGEDLTAFAARVDGKIQRSAGPEAEHQAKRPLLFHLEASHLDLVNLLTAAGYVVTDPADQPKKEIAMPRFTIEYCIADEFGNDDGEGWIVLEHGKRLDWPMLATREEAEADRLGFIKEIGQLESDEASEQRLTHSIAYGVY